MTWELMTRIVEPKSYPPQISISLNTLPGQLNQGTVATESNAIIEELWKRCFLCDPTQGYIPMTEKKLQNVVHSLCCVHVCTDGQTRLRRRQWRMYRVKKLNRHSELPSWNKAKKSPASEDRSRWTQTLRNYALVESVTGEHLAKPQ
jgi:hypothetical protein